MTKKHIFFSSHFALGSVDYLFFSSSQAGGGILILESNKETCQMYFTYDIYNGSEQLIFYQYSDVNFDIFVSKIFRTISYFNLCEKN